jgi:branched-subunit amino acid aminotransferase/4-amino-4-deoxychorismate lyase
MSSFCASWLWNGHRFEPSEGLPFSDRGARYGMAVFETLRVHKGCLQFWEPHQQRLLEAASKCGFAAPAEALSEAATLFPLDAREGVARLYVTAGDGAPADPATNCRVALLFEERRRLLPASYGLAISPLPHIPPFGGLKTANYWANAESLRQARAAGADEALLFGPAGEMIGACMANVFLKTSDGWVTPPLACGARAGVVRAWTMDRLGAQEKRLQRADVLSAKALFLTSSWIGVMPVNRIESVPGWAAATESGEEIENLRLEWESLGEPPA